MITAQPHDRYPSRLDQEVQFLDRVEPIVRGRAMDGPLSAPQLDEFDRNGFLHLPEVFSPAEVVRMASEMRQMSSDPDVRSQPSTIVNDDSGQVRSVFAFERQSHALDAVLHDERVAGAARQLLGSAVYLHQTRINYKPGFGGGGFDWHSDFETWHTEDGMPRMRAVSASILLTDNHTQNGPLLLVPGSHRAFLVSDSTTPRRHYRQSLQKQTAGIADRKLFQIMHERHGIHTATGAAGSMILFECNTLHGSNGNITPDPRSNVFAVYNSVENRLADPFAAPEPRPEWLAHRDNMTLAG